MVIAGHYKPTKSLKAPHSQRPIINGLGALIPKRAITHGTIHAIAGSQEEEFAKAGLEERIQQNGLHLMADWDHDSEMVSRQTARDEAKQADQPFALKRNGKAFNGLPVLNRRYGCGACDEVSMQLLVLRQSSGHCVF
jgi:hypothetical protein